MNKLYNAVQAVPDVFELVLNSINNMNLNNPINIDNNSYGYYDVEPFPIREVSFKIVKLSDGSLKLDLDFTNRDDSISIHADVDEDHEIQNLHVSGIQPSTLNNSTMNDEDYWD